MRERDFEHGHHWWVYGLVAVLLVVFFVMILIGLAKLIVGDAIG